MPETDDWLTHYGESHQDMQSPLLYWFAVPLVVIGVVGLLWSLPVPAGFTAISPLLNWGSAFLMVSVVYYFIISVSLAIGMLPFILGLGALQLWLIHTGYSLSQVTVGLLFVGIVGLWFGYRRENAYRYVIRDLHLMMIAPAWLLARLYQRFGIPY